MLRLLFSQAWNREAYLLESFLTLPQIPDLCGSAECRAAFQSAYAQCTTDLRMRDVCAFESQTTWIDTVFVEFFYAGVRPPDCADFLEVSHQMADGLWRHKADICT